MNNESPPSYDSIKKQKNIPYRPSEDQQKHIELLSQHTPVTELSAVSTNAETKYFDVLPSFQMFQSILRRDDRQFTEDLTSRPPGYQARNTSNMSRMNSIDANLNEVNSRLNDLNLQQEYNLQNYSMNDVGLSPVASQSHNESNVIHDSYGLSPLDNIDKLSKSTHSPIDIQIYVTKQVPQPNAVNQLETRLKEYTNGEFVNGYIIVTNKSDNPVNFGSFTVSLEGTIKQRKSDKALLKKFLKMYDLNASYGYTLVPNSAGIEYEPFEIDKSDDIQIGLPNDRILLPNAKYKKFFTFKFPQRLLDNICASNTLSHLTPPPSMGIDRSSFYNRSENVELNKALGYGFLNVRGTTLLTRDYSFEDISISYTIEAKFIDKKESKDSVRHDEITIEDYYISKSMQYFLKFVPNKTTYSSIKVYQELKNSLTWDLICKENEKVEREINENLNRVEFSVEELKNKNLKQLKSPQNHKINQVDKKSVLKSSITDIHGKKKLFGSQSKIGGSYMAVNIPNSGIPYSSPKLLMRYNENKEIYFKDDISLDVELHFVTTESSVKPPPISSIDINIVCWSYNSEYPVPFDIGYDFFYNNYSTHDDQIVRSNLQLVKDQVTTYMEFIKECELDLSKESLMYLNSMKTLGIKKDKIKEYFKQVKLEPSWNVDLGSNFHWNSKFKVPLNVVNKNNINLLPTFQSCLVGRLYNLELNIKYKGVEHNDNIVTIEIPISVG